MSISASKTKSSESKEILIVGVGNPLLGDEAVGARAVENLRRMDMPSDVRILDCGCDLLSLASYIDKPRKIIVIDAIRRGAKPGHIHTFDLDELEAIQIRRTSAHQLQVVDALRLLRQAYQCLTHCRIILMGIEPRSLGLNTELSQEVKESIPELTRLVLEEVSPSSAVRQGAGLRMASSTVEAEIHSMT